MWDVEEMKGLEYFPTSAQDAKIKSKINVLAAVTWIYSWPTPYARPSEHFHITWKAFHTYSVREKISEYKTDVQDLWNIKHESGSTCKTR